MEKQMRVLLTFPPSAPFYRVISAIREIGKTSLPVRPSVGLPDFDEDDEEQLAMFNQLQQYGVRLDDTMEVTTDEDAAAEEREEEERRRADWEAVTTAATANANAAAMMASLPVVAPQDDGEGPAASGPEGDAQVLADLQAQQQGDQITSGTDTTTQSE